MSQRGDVRGTGAVRQSSRRTLLASLALLFAAGPPFAFAAGVDARVRRIALVFWRVPPSQLALETDPVGMGVAAFRKSLRERGWREPEDVEILLRSAEGSIERARAIIGELIRIPVDVLVISGNGIAVEATRMTRKVPIVMLFSQFPVQNGLVESLSRPGGNVTGLVAYASPEVMAKRLALLKEISPRVFRVAVMQESSESTGLKVGLGLTPEGAKAAESLGISAFPVVVDAPSQLEAAFAEAVRLGAQGVVFDSSVAAAEAAHPAIHGLAHRYRLPVIHSFIQAVRTGGLMGYASWDFYEAAARYVDRILRGADPATMAMEHAGRYSLLINRRTARALGLEIPASLLLQASRVFE